MLRYFSANTVRIYSCNDYHLACLASTDDVLLTLMVFLDFCKKIKHYIQHMYAYHINFTSIILLKHLVMISSIL